MSQSLEPVTVTLYVIQDFADVIKLRILKWGDYPELSGWALNAITNILIRRRSREIRYRTRESLWPETETVVMWLQIKES